MIALILAVGYATRLYPLTKDTPKPFLPVQGSRTILDLLVGRLEVLDEITEILIVTNERFFGAFEQWHQQWGNPAAPSYFPEWLHSRPEIWAYYTEGTIDDVGTTEAYAEMRTSLGNRQSDKG
ncbi:sugar phosphate nucleotidyltransferase [Paenibacillus sp. NPDC057886]|uniref:sugar phosphate nucleotidyltransferase n=1 Tax=Paenibacillus sp. NPDC057886 TaxID=3346270 RepID=UPI0036B4723A